MRDELAEEWPTGRFRSERRRIVLHVAAVAEPAGPTEGVQEGFVCRERGQVGEQARVRGRTDCGINFPGTGRRETVCVFHVEILAPTPGSDTARLGGWNRPKTPAVYLRFFLDAALDAFLAGAFLGGAGAT